MSRRSPFTSATFIAASLALAGCASTLSGVGGSNHYGCKAPPGTVCTSVSGVYANGPSGKAAPVRSGTRPGAAPAPEPYGALTIPSTSHPNPVDTESLRTTPRVLTLWIAPWEDRDGDLHEAANVHVLVNTGRWRTEHVRPARVHVPEVVAPATTKPAPKDAIPADDPPQAR